jgi:hypothetical protein
MKPRTFVLLLGVALGGVALGTPLYAQSWHVSVGGVFAAGQQYPQGSRYQPYPGRPGDDRGYGYGSGYRYDEYARSAGYRDGYEKGFDASRDRDRFDPRREHWYRDGDRGYKRDAYMTRDRYRDVYRRGFLEGYEAGYRDAQRGYRGGGYGPQGSRGNSWPYGWR